jgi:hypothetical protein
MYQQLLAHVFGDFILQSDWMALNKNKKTIPCLVHVILYTSVFLLLTTSWKALLVIGGTHFIIDRFPIIIKRLIWMKNFIGPKWDYPYFDACSFTGYYDDSPYNECKLGRKDEVYFRFLEETYGKPRHFFITMWLYIITDNFFHLFINYLALKYL